MSTPFPMPNLGDHVATFPGEIVWASELIIGQPYVGHASTGDLGDMLFYVTSEPFNVGPADFDPNGPDLLELTVTVGVESWEVLLPIDSYAVLVNTD